MEWIAHKGWQEKGAPPNSRQALRDGTQTNFRLEFDLLWHRGKVLIAHDRDHLTSFYLEEALEIVESSTNSLSLDIKNEGGEKYIQKALENFSDPERILLCGHSWQSLQKIEGPFLRGWSFPGPEENPQDIIQRTVPGELCDGFMLHYSIAREPLVREIQEWGGWVHAWTLDEPWQLRDLGPVDGITSNRPEVLRQALETTSRNQ